MSPSWHIAITVDRFGYHPELRQRRSKDLDPRQPIRFRGLRSRDVVRRRPHVRIVQNCANVDGNPSNCGRGGVRESISYVFAMPV